MHWWMLIPILAVIVMALYGLFRWASAAPDIDVENARDDVQADQDWRGLHRSGIDAVPHRQR